MNIFPEFFHGQILNPILNIEYEIRYPISKKSIFLAIFFDLFSNSCVLGLVYPENNVFFKN